MLKLFLPILCALLSFASCSTAQRCPVEKVEGSTKVRLGALTLVLSSEFQREEILIKDVARWRYRSPEATLTMESGADLSDYPGMREKLKLDTTFREYDFNIEGEQATIFTFVSTSNGQGANGTRDSTYVSGLYIPEKEQRARILLTYEGKSQKAFAEGLRIFCSVRVE